jgi:hypothetical protein
MRCDSAEFFDYFEEFWMKIVSGVLVIVSMKRRDRAKTRELHLDDGATEIAIILRFDLLFQSLHDYFGDVSEFHILCRIVALSEIVDPSKGKITRR